MRVSLAVLVGGAVAAGGAIAGAYGAHAGIETGLLLLVLGAGWLAAAHGLGRNRRRLGSLRRQFALGVTVAVGMVIVAAVALAQLMFVSAEDAALIVVSIAFAGLVAIRAAQLVAGGVLGDVEEVRDALVAFAGGERSVRIETGGQDELAELAAETNSALARLGATEQARRNLVAAVSHDLRTPLTSLRLLADAVDDGLVDDATRGRYLASMSTHIEALGLLIDDLFELSLLEAGDIEWTMERTQLDELVRDSVAAMRVQAEAAGIRVVAEVPSDLGAARANPERLQRVLFNLIQNAIRHTPADGSVTVRAEPTQAEIEIEVADTGAGLAAGEDERIFEPYYRGGGETARAGDGAGLGLSISRAIVEAHGGRISISGNGGGTRVCFTLPRAA